MQPSGATKGAVFWAVTGLALPLSFAQHAEPALYYLAPGRLPALYGTEWLLFAFAGLLLAAAWHGLRRVAPAHWRPRLSTTRAAGAVVVAAIFAGSLAALGVTTSSRRLLIVVATAVTLVVLLPNRWIPQGLAARVLPRLRFVALLGACAVAAIPLDRQGASAQEAAAEGRRERPDIVLLTIDTLSAAHMSLHGYGRSTTPSLDRFAANAIVFERAYANGNFTTTGISSILTGTRPWTHRALQLPGQPIAGVASASLPAALRGAGYETIAVATNAWADPHRLGLGRHFDEVIGDRTPGFSLCANWSSQVAPLSCAAMQNNWLAAVDAVMAELLYLRHAKDSTHFDPASSRVAVEQILDRPRDRPLFLWVHLLPPHDPYSSPAPFLGRFDDGPAARDPRSSRAQYGYVWRSAADDQRRTLTARYDEAISYADAEIGLLLELIDRRLGRDAAIVVSSDHGESFGHGYGGHAGPALYEELIRIPLLLALPERTGGRRTEIVEQIDIAPTLATIAGAPVPPSWEGRSLLAANAGAADHVAFSMNFEQSRARGSLSTGTIATITPAWKLVETLGHPRYPQAPPPQTELFDVAGDPGETRNLAGERPDVVARLSQLRGVATSGRLGPLQ